MLHRSMDQSPLVDLTSRPVRLGHSLLNVYGMVHICLMTCRPEAFVIHEPMPNPCINIIFALTNHSINGPARDMILKSCHMPLLRVFLQRHKQSINLGVMSDLR